MQTTTIDSVSKLIKNSETLLFITGAGASVDSGLPDFRGENGFWKAYPMFQKLQLSFYQIANPRWFIEDYALAWGFYGHRLNLYRNITPHNGYDILAKWSKTKPTFAITTNVDNTLQKVGITDIWEVHGTIEYVQCLNKECNKVYPTPKDLILAVDLSTMRVTGDLPTCIYCKGKIRPNILMFSDWQWDESLSNSQEKNFNSFMSTIGNKSTTIIEIGAGTAISTARMLGHSYFKTRVISDKVMNYVRINLDVDADDEVLLNYPKHYYKLQMKAKEALELLDKGI